MFEDLVSAEENSYYFGIIDNYIDVFGQNSFTDLGKNFKGIELRDEVTKRIESSFLKKTGLITLHFLVWTLLTL